MNISIPVKEVLMVLEETFFHWNKKLRNDEDFNSIGCSLNDSRVSVVKFQRMGRTQNIYDEYIICLRVRNEGFGIEDEMRYAEDIGRLIKDGD